MSDEVPVGRLSQIFDTLTNIQQQQQQQAEQQRRRSASSSPSPSASASASSSGRATPSALGLGAAASQTLYYTHTHSYFLRPQDGTNYLHTFPAAQQPQPAHYLQQQQQQHAHQLAPHWPQICSSGSQSLQGSPLLAKRATSFSGQMPLTRAQLHEARLGLVSASTPNSPRLLPRRAARPPPIPAKPTKEHQPPAAASNVNPVLAALDAPDAPWPHFSSLTEHLDVHQLNNYGKALPEINWQERCLELQLELHRSKNQAGRIRDMLREKVSFSTIQCL